ncbi:MAG: hypothetical protein IT304_03660 [Dehalococcoidia bacterium]|nr:hypothetical protein [Dehalococcoidia bacterium]
MRDEAPTCPDCSAPFDQADNYCRRCGMYLAALRPAPAPPVPLRPQTALAPARAALPAPVKKAAAAVAIGTALQVGLGLAGRYLASQAARQAATAAVKAPRAVARAERTPPVERASSADEALAVSETFLIRRVWIRRS